MLWPEPVNRLEKTASPDTYPSHPTGRKSLEDFDDPLDIVFWSGSAAVAKDWNTYFDRQFRCEVIPSP